MLISIGIDENGRPFVKTSDQGTRRAVREGKGKSLVKFPKDKKPLNFLRLSSRPILSMTT